MVYFSVELLIWGFLNNQTITLVDTTMAILFMCKIIIAKPATFIQLSLGTFSFLPMSSIEQCLKKGTGGSQPAGGGQVGRREREKM
jgi:hypothetical protein